MWIDFLLIVIFVVTISAKLTEIKKNIAFTFGALFLLMVTIPFLLFGSKERSCSRIDNYKIVVTDSTYTTQRFNIKSITTITKMRLSFVFSENNLTPIKNNDWLFLDEPDTMAVNITIPELIFHPDTIQGVYYLRQTNLYDKVVFRNIIYKINNKFYEIFNNKLSERKNLKCLKNY